MKNRLWLILFLLIIWCSFSHNIQLPNVLLGLAISFLIPYLAIPRSLNFNVNVVQLLMLALFMIWELILSSFEVTWDIITPKNKSQPKIIHLPLQCQHPVQISLLANLVSLTPGTLVVDIAEGNGMLVIHIMFAQRQDRIVAFIKQKLEPKIIKVIKNG